MLACQIDEFHNASCPVQSLQSVSFALQCGPLDAAAACGTVTWILLWRLRSEKRSASTWHELD